MKLDQIDPSLAGQGVKIGIIDSGCDNSHPQLTHITRGMDFTNNRDTASWTRDTMSHGTHCAGIITGAATQLKGVRGFAPMAEVHALKVFPGGRFSDLIDALDQCIDRQLDIVNLSLGSSETSELVAHKLVEVRQSGVACIVAAGNASGPVQFPGSEPSVLTVSAIGKLEEFPADTNHAQTVVPNLVAGSMFSPKFTCFGPQIAVAGPGVAIVSTVPGGGYASWDGTSMATPHITGMGALLLAHHPTFRDGNRVRNEQRVAQLFSLLASAGVRMLGDPTREGVGVPDLQRVAGLGAAPRPTDTVQTASAPIGGILGNKAPVNSEISRLQASSSRRPRSRVTSWVNSRRLSPTRSRRTFAQTRHQSGACSRACCSCAAPDCCSAGPHDASAGSDAGGHFLLFAISFLLFSMFLRPAPSRGRARDAQPDCDGAHSSCRGCCGHDS